MLVDPLLCSLSLDALKPWNLHVYISLSSRQIARSETTLKLTSIHCQQSVYLVQIRAGRRRKRLCRRFFSL